MTRNTGLANPRLSDDLANRLLAGTKSLDDTAARRVSEDLEGIFIHNSVYIHMYMQNASFARPSPKKMASRALLKRPIGERRDTGGPMNKVANRHASNGILWIRIFLLGLAVGLALSTLAMAQTAASGQTPLMDREKEVALALSACPGPVASKAAVYVLGPTGYIKIRDSQNGFTAIVQHALPTSQEPQCLDAEGTRTHLPRILKIAELRAQGKSREEIKRYVAEAFAKGIFQPPARPGIDYMLSTENLVPNDKGIATPFPPHVMFYAPYLTNANIGSDGSHNGPVFVVGEGTPHALIIVPVGARVGHAPAAKGSGGSQ